MVELFREMVGGQVEGKIFSYPENLKALKILIAAK